MMMPSSLHMNHHDIHQNKKMKMMMMMQQRHQQQQLQQMAMPTGTMTSAYYDMPLVATTLDDEMV